VQDKVQVDSVMYIPNGNVKLVTTETRVVNVEPSSDEGIQGTYDRAPTISYILKDTKEKMSFNNFFNKEKVGEFYLKKDNDLIKDELPEIEVFLEEFLKSIDYNPTCFVSGDLIEQEHTYRTPTYSHGATYNVYDSYGEEWGEEWEDDVMESDSKPATKKYQPPVYTPKPKIRPTWRKHQTLNNLKNKYKVNLDKSPGITGEGDESDIIAIAQELKLRKITDVHIRKFFREMDYPNNALETYYKDLA
jgi:hypothetical protein